MIVQYPRRPRLENITAYRFVKPDSNFSINHAASLRPRTLLPPTAHSSRRCEVHVCSREWRFSLVNLYPLREVGEWISREERELHSRAKRRAAAVAAEAAVVELSFAKPPPFSAALNLVPFFLRYLPRHPLVCTLSALPLWSFRSRRSHISTYGTEPRLRMYARGYLTCDALSFSFPSFSLFFLFSLSFPLANAAREGDSGRRGEALCIGNFKS